MGQTRLVIRKRPLPESPTDVANRLILEAYDAMGVVHFTLYGKDGASFPKRKRQDMFRELSRVSANCEILKLWLKV